MEAVMGSLQRTPRHKLFAFLVLAPERFGAIKAQSSGDPRLQITGHLNQGKGLGVCVNARDVSAAADHFLRVGWG